MNQFIKIIFEGFANPVGYIPLVVIICILFWLFLKTKTDSNNLRVFQKIVLLSSLIVLILICLYYPIEKFLFEHFSYDKSEINIYTAATGILITTIGVIVTSIFSYLIYIATKQGLEITKAQNIISERLEDIEEKRMKEERILKYNNINNVPEIRLLMSIDFLLVQIENLEQEIIVKYGRNERFGSTALADAIDDRTFEKDLKEKFDNILKKTQENSDSFIQLLLINNLNIHFDDNFRNQMRLKALTINAFSVYAEIHEKIGLSSIQAALEHIRSKILFEVKNDILELYKGLINEQIFNSINKPKIAYEKIWSRYITKEEK